MKKPTKRMTPSERLNNLNLKADVMPIARSTVAYVRVSTSEQEEEGYSIPAQTRAAEVYASHKSLHILKVYATAESAKKEGRKQFGEMCQLIKSAKGPMVMLVEKMDRLTRNMPDLVTVDELVQKHDLEIHFFRENKIYNKHSSADDVFMLHIQAALAKRFIDNLRAESNKGMVEKAAQGYYPSRPPVGYLNNPMTRHIDLDPERANIVHRLFTLYAAGGHSIDDLCTIARQDGIATAAAGRGSVTRNTINNLLKNPFYTGIFCWKGLWYEGKHKPLVSQALFDKVQAVMTGRTSGQTARRNHAVNGLLKCGYCGYAVTGETQKGKYVYYHCTGRQKACPKPYVREERLAELMGQAIASLQVCDCLLETYTAAIESSQAEQLAYRKRQRTHLRQEETKLHSQLKQTSIHLINGTIDAEEHKELKLSFNQALEEVRSRLAELGDDESPQARGVTLLELAQRAYPSYLQRSALEKRELLDFVCSNFSVTAEEAVPTYRQPFALIASSVAMTQKGKEPDLSDPTLAQLGTPNLTVIELIFPSFTLP